MAYILTHILDFILHIFCDIVSDTLSGSVPHNDFDILSGVLSRIYSDILFGILSDILSGILPDICSGLLSGTLSGILSYLKFIDILSATLC